MQNHIDLKIGTTEALLDILKDNRKLLKKISDIEIQFFINLLINTKKEERSIYISFLSSVCNVNETSIQKNQDYIIENLIIKNKNILNEILILPFQEKNNIIFYLNNDLKGFIYFYFYF
jgi:hypothetical protein